MKNMINSEPSMTSKEISELVSKRHDNVKRTIEKLAKDGVIRHPQIEDYERINNLGFLVTDKCYRFIGEQGRRDSIVVVAQLSPEFTGLMVDRWQKLERKVALLSAEERTIQHQHKVDVVALACAVAETTVTTAIKAAIEAVTVQQEKLASQRRDSDDFVVFDYSSADSDVDNSAFQPIHALSAKSGLADSACRRLIEFAHVPARKIGRSGLHADSDAFVAAACKLIGESETPKGKIKRWQHPEFGGFILRRALSVSDQEKQD
ncbi:hypothetical protein CED64_16050 [Salmonella enterica]|uniref:DNA-binding protein n=2 Tax=Salmonella enterica TaxID=28901 RepID=A0A5U3EPR7_SALET|nr:hypothetical protein [Salmonella enterica subsp. diarizonae]EAM8780153.1 hypothetical protein [Salmonella enterica]EBP3998945.1 hypothetical protein [Salmonella enterica subsp. enterica]EAA5231265.1 hypothetical protein [Salmonella enterica subsp. diarizonae]EAQ0533172.1 hypothetical protein [Salmonella enterica]